MSQYDNCQNCFMPLGGNTVCPNCGRDNSKNRQYAGVLPPFTILNNRYLVGRVLGKGGFGVTYIAKDMISNSICAIKEFMPAEYCSRSGTLQIIPFSDSKASYVFNHGREKFVEEARTLVKLRNNPIVVDIRDYFNENNTAYLVMEYLDGQDLRQMAKSNGGKLEPGFAKAIFVTIASSLMEIHRKNILHRDLSPENIIVTSNGRIKLIDFGAARNFVSTQNKGMSILLKPGFAPPEQYNAKGNQGPWSDVYALCATFYHLVSGKPLVDALFRYRGEQQPSLFALQCPVTKKTSDVIERGMELDYKRRYKDFKEVLDDIDIDVSSAQVKPVQDKPVVPQVPLGTSNNIRQVEVRRVTPPGGSKITNTGTTGNGVNGIRKVQGTITEQPQPYVGALVGNNVCNPVMLKPNDILIIGRSSQSCRFVIAGDTNISRTHCYIRFDGRKLFLTDDSGNGTYFANGTRLVRNREYEIDYGTKFYLATPNHMLVINKR